MAALNYLGDAEIAAHVRYNATTTANRAKLTYSRLYLACKGTIDERKAQAICAPDYIEDLERAAQSERELERHEANVLNSKMVIEIWRTESANVRQMERVR